jgi:hypothetical protein
LHGYSIQFGNSFCMAIQFGLAKRIQFDNSAIRFGNSDWQNEFNLTIRQFGSAIRFGKTNSI